MKLWSEGYKCTQKKAFSVVPKASPRHPNHVTICLLRHSGESLQNGQLELRRRNGYLSRETHKDTAVSVWASQAGSLKSISIPWGLRNRTHQVLATQMGVMRRSKKVRSFELYKFNPLSPHCRSIARELVHCYTWGRLRNVTVRGNTVGRHSWLFWSTTRIHSLLKNLRWQPHWLPRLTSLPGSHVTDGEPETVVSVSLQKIKSIKNPNILFKKKNALHLKLVSHLSVITMVILHT